MSINLVSSEDVIYKKRGVSKKTVERLKISELRQKNI